MENSLEQFVFGRKTLSAPPAPKPAARRSREHSRSGSISQPITPQPPQSDAEPLQPMPRSRPNSLHKRHSSVSNRRESAELMGIPLPPEDPAKDSLQDPVLRALLALEGHRSASNSPRNSFNNRIAKVQIPDFDAIEKSDLAESRRPALTLNSSLAGKRDSFGKLLTPASSMYMELGTLVEEEEEDEDDSRATMTTTNDPTPVPAPAPTPVVTTPSAFKFKPQTPDCRSLTVSTGPVVPPATSSIPTPAATPSPRIAGLRSLTLGSSPLVHASPLSAGVRHSPSACKGLVRKSSISYKRSDEPDMPRSPPEQHTIAFTRPTLMPSLMTPELTPTSLSPPGTPSDMSPSRRTFIYQSHSALVSRVSELERLLAAQSPSAQSPQSTTANDEFLSLIADLKAERDELKRDVRGWRTRVADLEKQNKTLSNRVENERREAWVLREQLGVLKIEKATLDNDHNQLQTQVDELQEQVLSFQAQLDQMRRERDEAKCALERASRPAPNARVNALGSGFSIDSLSSATDVESVVSQRSSLVAGLAMKLKVVEEEESEYYPTSGQNRLRDSNATRYSDDSDDSFYSRSRPNSACSITLSVGPASPADERPMQNNRASLSRTWNFAKASSAPRAERKPAEVDRFFVCLEDPEDSDEDHTLTRSSHGFGGFGAPLDEDDMPPFVIPSHHSNDIKFTIVSETDEDDDLDFVVPVKADSEPAFKPAPVQFSFPRRVLGKPSPQAVAKFPPVLKARSSAVQRW